MLIRADGTASLPAVEDADGEPDDAGEDDAGADAGDDDAVADRPGDGGGVAAGGPAHPASAITPTARTKPVRRMIDSCRR
ncbi:hypothetical protein BKD30_00315 [Tersicoccus phoenicis]|uniref:Uncharacterized protein n=1 Tax=Tersicoccus phoenicis TaxID=554083 RepID=A0A1R1LPV8_9MICC|nr:hypothetical protein BKD30_00315 [Tersicoccus phoenicis]